jgi:hypothetical protein
MRHRKTERQWILQTRRELLSPRPLECIDDLEREVGQRPRYVGPGPWLAAARKNDTDKETQKRRRKGE